jgi:hypothetical protein
MDGNLVIEPTIDYDFSKLYLGPPSTLAGGAYFTRIMYNTNKQLFIQTPKSLTKQGFIKSGKKIYTDLMFDNNDTVFINWIENLETKCHDLIYTKGQNWFETKLEKMDIENAFTSPFKIYKSGKHYLLRVNVKHNIKMYDETDKNINIDDVTSDKTLISILEIQGIKFSSRNFQLEIELKQSMLVSPDPFLESCFIKRPVKKNTYMEQQLEKEKTSLEETINLEKEKTSLEETIDLDDLINSSVEQLTKSKQMPAKSTTTIKETTTTKGTKNNIILEIEEFTPEPEPEPETDELKEYDLTSSIDNNLESITLKKPNQVYYEIYQKAREKAKETKKTAVQAYLEMKNIKKTYMLDDIDDSDSDFDGFNSEDETQTIDLNAETLEDSF